MDSNVVVSLNIVFRRSFVNFEKIGTLQNRMTDVVPVFEVF